MLPRYGQDISYQEALELNRANSEERWLGREEDNRLEPEAWPRVTPRFKLKRGQRIFTIGSCFARNIEEYLDRLGFDIPTLRMAAPDAEGGRANAILNKYTPVAIAQELEWTRRIIDRDGVVRWSDIEPLLLETSSGEYLDLHLSTSAPLSRERALERRAELFAINRDGFDSDVVVVTPGVIEAWLDTAAGLYVQRMPNPRMARRGGEERFRFKVLTYEECYAALSRAVDLVDPGGGKRFLFTVSPVPLSRTFTDQDIIVANQYSKSLLRAVVGRVCSERSNCDYFPSYESVMLTRQAYVWQKDLVHVSDRFISKIVQRLVSSRLEGAGPEQAAPDPLFAELDQALRKGRKQALAVYRKLGERAVAVEVPGFHEKAIKMLLRAGESAAALAHAEKLVSLRPGTWKPLYLLARAQYRCGDAARARQTAAEALARAGERGKNRAAIEKLIGRLSGPRRARREPASPT